VVKDPSVVFVLVMVISQGMIKTRDAICYYMWTQSEPHLRESQLAQKGEPQKDFLLGSGGREMSPKNDIQVA
jgi:hypothetical protein